MKKTIILVTGIFFLIFGLLGLALPFLQGILFLIVGLFLVSFCFPKFRLWVNKQAQKHPYSFKAIQKAEKWMTKIFGQI